MNTSVTKISCFSEASRLALGYMKPGVLTNHVMSADEYRADIAGGLLYAYQWPGGLLFLRNRELYHLLGYYIGDINELPGCDFPDNTVIEIPHKPSIAGAAAAAAEYWVRAGFEHTLERVRLTRGVTGHNPSGNAQFATPQDVHDCYELLRGSFHPVTGHIPGLGELEVSVVNGHVLCVGDADGKVCGLLRWVPRAASVEIRQLALCEDMRGKGLAHRLLESFVDVCGGKKATVWARDGYAPALRAYTAAGFVVDGWRSYVLTKAGASHTKPDK